MAAKKATTPKKMAKAKPAAKAAAAPKLAFGSPAWRKKYGMK